MKKLLEDSHVDLEKDPTSGQFVPKIDGNILERFKVLPEGQSLVASSRNPQIAFPQGLSRATLKLTEEPS